MAGSDATPHDETIQLAICRREMCPSGIRLARMRRLATSLVCQIDRAAIQATETILADDLDNQATIRPQEVLAIPIDRPFQVVTISQVATMATAQFANPAIEMTFPDENLATVKVIHHVERIPSNLFQAIQRRLAIAVSRDRYRLAAVPIETMGITILGIEIAM
jgi:hypothetical protein